MSNLISISGVRGFIDETGTAQLSLEDCARGLGFTKTDVKGDKEYTRINKQIVRNWLIEFGILNSETEDLPEFIPENIFYRLAMKAKNETAERFQTKVADEILPAIRKTGTYSTTVKLTPQPKYRARMISTAVKDVDATAKQLMKLFAVKDGIAYAAAMNMVETVYQIDMSPVKKLLPSVDHEIGRLNATEIADKMNIRYKTGSPDPKTVNKRLIGAGLMVVTGDRKQPYALTDTGKDIGEVVPYTRGGHSGYEIRWNQSVVEILKENQIA